MKDDNEFVKEENVLLRYELRQKKKKLFIITCFTYGFAILAILGTFLTLQQVYPVYNFWGSTSTHEDPFEKVDILFENLSVNDANYFKSVFSEVNPLYLHKQQKLLVSYDISTRCPKNTACSGANRGNGEIIYIEFIRNKDYLRRLLSHEFMHSYFDFDGGDTPNHKIIYDLGRQQVAFN